MFSQVSVCSQGGGVSPHCMLGYTPPRTRGRHPPGPEADTPRQTPPWADMHPPWADTHPPGQTQPPAQCMLGYDQQAGGTHPSECILVLVIPPEMHSMLMLIREQQRYQNARLLSSG